MKFCRFPLITAAWRPLFVFLGFLFVWGCNYEKAAIRKETRQRAKAMGFFGAHPEEFARECSIRFSPELGHLGSDTIRVDDTIWIETRVPDSTTGGFIQCPPSKVIIRTVTIRDSFGVPDRAKEEALQRELDRQREAANQSAADAKKDREAADKSRAEQNTAEKKSKRRFWALIGENALILIALIVWAIIKMKSFRVKTD